MSPTTTHAHPAGQRRDKVADKPGLALPTPPVHQPNCDASRGRTPGPQHVQRGGVTKSVSRPHPRASNAAGESTRLPGSPSGRTPPAPPPCHPCAASAATTADTPAPRSPDGDQLTAVKSPGVDHHHAGQQPVTPHRAPDIPAHGEALAHTRAGGSSTRIASRPDFRNVPGLIRPEACSTSRTSGEASTRKPRRLTQQPRRAGNQPTPPHRPTRRPPPLTPATATSATSTGIVRFTAAVPPQASAAKPTPIRRSRT